MDTLEDAIRRLIKEQYGSITKFAEEVDVPQTSIYSALERGMANTRTELTDKIYRKLNIDWDSAKLDNFRELKVKNPNSSDFVEVPLYGSIAAGTPIEMIPVDETHPVPAKVMDKYPEAFLLRVKGRSMDKVLPDGCYALIDPCEEVERDNQPHAVCVNGYDATIKRVRNLANGIELDPDSTDPTFKPSIYDYGDENTEEITIIGRVVYYVLPFDWGF